MILRCRQSLLLLLLLLLGLPLLSLAGQSPGAEEAIPPPRELIGVWRTWAVLVAYPASPGVEVLPSGYASVPLPSSSQLSTTGSGEPATQHGLNTSWCQTYPNETQAAAAGIYLQVDSRSSLAGVFNIRGNGSLTHTYRAPDSEDWDIHAYYLLDWELLPNPRRPPGGANLTRFDQPAVYRLWLTEHTYFVRESERVCMLVSLTGTPAGYTLSVFRLAALNLDSSVPFPGVTLRLPSLAPSARCPAEDYDNFPSPGFTRLRFFQNLCGFTATPPTADLQLAQVLEVGTVAHTMAPRQLPDKTVQDTIPHRFQGVWVRQRRLVTDAGGSCTQVGAWGRITLNATHVVIEDEGLPIEVWEAVMIQVDKQKESSVSGGSFTADHPEDQPVQGTSPNSPAWDVRELVSDRSILAFRLVYKIYDQFPRFPGDKPRYSTGCLDFVETGMVEDPWLPPEPGVPPPMPAPARENLVESRATNGGDEEEEDNDDGGGGMDGPSDELPPWSGVGGIGNNSTKPGLDKARSLAMLAIPGHCRGFQPSEVTVDETQHFCGMQGRYTALSVSQYIHTQEAAQSSTSHDQVAQEQERFVAQALASSAEDILAQADWVGGRRRPACLGSRSGCRWPRTPPPEASRPPRPV